MLLRFNMTANTIHNLKKILLSVLAAATGLLTVGCGAPEVIPAPTDSAGVSFTATPSQQAFYNPLIGFAMEGSYSRAVADNTLVYIEISWKEIEPQEGVYDFSAVDEHFQVERWKQAGKHAVLRFLCDRPSTEDHIDIPQWLYDRTRDGTHYHYDDTHHGYSPDYNNPDFIKAHTRVIEALGRHYGRDSFVSFVELGSLGHWGEWHVNYESGIVRMPKEAVRDQYVAPYLSAFPNARLLMRRPFRAAKTHGMGLYDDMAGSQESTDRWLEWIRNGGDYRQALEENALVPMPDVWETAPIGGEFTSSIPMLELLTSQLDTTLSLLEKSHTSFLGPHAPHGLREEMGSECGRQIDAIRSAMGYRLYIPRASYRIDPESGDYAFTLVWANDGNAPMYWDWETRLCFYDRDQNLLGLTTLDLQLTRILPGKEITVAARVDPHMLENARYITVGIEDPMTQTFALRLAMDVPQIRGTSVLWQLGDET